MKLDVLAQIILIGHPLDVLLDLGTSRIDFIPVWIRLEVEAIDMLFSPASH
jgi:hypothetical protein